MSTTEHKALELADRLQQDFNSEYINWDNVIEAVTELRRLSAENEALRLQIFDHQLVLRGWEVRTEWLRTSLEPWECGDHLADVLRARIEALRAQVEALQKAAEHLPWIGHGADWTEAKPVYLVATGEVNEGQETYTRHDAPVPLADQEVLFTRPPEPLTRPAVPEGWKLVPVKADPKMLAVFDASDGFFVRYNKANEPAARYEAVSRETMQVVGAFATDDEADALAARLSYEKHWANLLAAAPQPGAQPTEAAQKGGV